MLWLFTFRLWTLCIVFFLALLIQAIHIRLFTWIFFVHKRFLCAYNSINGYFSFSIFFSLFKLFRHNKQMPRFSLILFAYHDSYSDFFLFFSGNKVLQALLRDVSAEAVNKYNFTVNWTQNNYAFVRDPLFFGTLISIFTMMIIYFDSDIPGVSPPTPFSPRKANR